MHDQAIITNDDPKLHVTAGKLVNIYAVKDCYKTSEAAKVNGYQCACQKCGVPVTAVIPKKIKPGRKTSPSPYFAARSKPHVDGCTREPEETTETSSTPKPPTKEAHPNRRSGPTVWVDPEKDTKDTKKGEDDENTDDKSRPRQTRSGSGTGTSEGRSNKVEAFARSWLRMKVEERKQAPLRAQWNSGGTFYSAFYPFIYYRDASGQKERRIFVGTLKSLFEGDTGYTITLAEKNTDGKDLKVWVKKVALDERIEGGLELDTLLFDIKSNGKIYEGRDVFALGNFAIQHSRSRSTSWYSIVITHPFNVWIRPKGE